MQNDSLNLCIVQIFWNCCNSIQEYNFDRIMNLYIKVVIFVKMSIIRRNEIASHLIKITHLI